MIYTETEKKELDEVRRVFAEHLRRARIMSCCGRTRWVTSGWPSAWSRFMWIPGRRIESAEDLCRECLESIGMDTLYLTDNDHGLENADPLERAEIRRRWKPFMDQLPQSAYLCGEILPQRD